MSPLKFKDPGPRVAFVEREQIGDVRSPKRASRLRGSRYERRGHTYVRYHWEVERRRHSTLVNAGFLGTDVSADIPRPQVGGHQDAGLFLAISFRDEKIEFVPASAEFARVDLGESRDRTFFFED